jgi:hypothetical protein
MSGQYRAGQYVTISGWDCGTEIELRMIVAFKVPPRLQANAHRAR